MTDSRVAGSLAPWQMFHANRSCWPAALALCEDARQSIAIEQYIFSSEGIGRRFLDLLTFQARRGVQVRVLADWYGSRSLLASDAAVELTRAGGELRHFHDVGHILADPRRALHRLHRKSVISDGRRLMTGGSCVDPRMADWRDTMVSIEGIVAELALSEFTASWQYAGDERGSPSAGTSAPDESDPGWNYVASSPYPPAAYRYRDMFLARISRAKNHVLLASPYVTPARGLWRTLAEAAQRGVKVTVLIPARTDHPSLDLAMRPFVRTLSKGGIEFLGYTETMLHAKLAVIDDRWAAVGSFNLGIDSTWMNLEAMLVGAQQDFIEAVADQLTRDLATATRL